jgi:DNA helicase MCM8
LCLILLTFQRLQEVVLDPKDVESGRIPRTIECELTEDLTGVCTPGDLITVNGIVKALTLETSGIGRSNKDKCTFLLYIDVDSLQGQGLASLDDNKSTMSFNKDIEFTPNELKGFKAIQSEKDTFKYELLNFTFQFKTYFL